jgi:hypothetical protein
VFDDGTPVFSKSISRSRFSAPPNGGRRPSHIPIEHLPTPDDEKAIFAALQQLQEKVAQLERERTEAENRIDEQDLELIELRATTQAQEKLRRSDSAQGSENSSKNGWKVEKTRKFRFSERYMTTNIIQDSTLLYKHSERNSIAPTVKLLCSRLRRSDSTLNGTTWPANLA